VARSNIDLLKTLGAHVGLVGPSTLLPSYATSMAHAVYHNLDEALAEGFDVVMMLRMQMERMNSVFVPNANEYSTLWGLSAERFNSLNSKTLIMHPGPMNRGLEISSEAADSQQSAIVDQVRNGVAVRMAVLFKLLAQESSSK
jgi:aspartate carbamoyltransferase catalytic subunit